MSRKASLTPRMGHVTLSKSWRYYVKIVEQRTGISFEHITKIINLLQSTTFFSASSTTFTITTHPPTQTKCLNQEDPKSVSNLWSNIQVILELIQSLREPFTSLPDQNGQKGPRAQEENGRRYPKVDWRVQICMAIQCWRYEKWRFARSQEGVERVSNEGFSRRSGCLVVMDNLCLLFLLFIRFG